MSSSTRRTVSTVDVEAIRARLRAHADTVASRKHAWRNSIIARNAAIRDAVDSGLLQTIVAKDAGVKQPQVVRILADGDDLDAVTL